MSSPDQKEKSEKDYNRVDTTKSVGDRRQSNEETSLSRFLHSAFFQPIVRHDKTAMEKFVLMDRINSFLSDEQKQQQQQSHECGHLRNQLFSPLVSDVHISIHRPQIDEFNLGGSAANNSAMTIQSGIQLPVIDWHREFRKGYSLLMWVRLHNDDDNKKKEKMYHGGNDNDVSTEKNKSVQKDDSSSISSFSHFNEEPDPQLLYRFATSASPMAHGVQATLHRDTGYASKDDDNDGDDDDDSNDIPVIVHVETLRPISPSKIDNLHSVTLPNSLTTKSILIPNGQWTLICIQHSFPYLKRPLMSVSVNGVEIEKAEMAYPTLGGETGEVMMDNYLLCNLPSWERNLSQGEGEKGRRGNDDHTSSLLNVSQVDFAGFGLFKESIPTLLQAIICEHGPCASADGVIPAVPPVVQAKDGIVVGSTANQGNLDVRGSGGSGGVRRSPKRSAGMTGGPFGLSSHRITSVSEGRGIGIPLCAGVQLTEEVSHKGDLIIQQLLSKLVLGLNGSDVFKFGDKFAFTVNTSCNIGITADAKMVGIVHPKPPNRKNDERKNRDSAPAPDNPNGCIAKCIGNISIYHATERFLDTMTKSVECGSFTSPIAVPRYDIPRANIASLNPLPSLISTFISVDPIAYILQPFHLALPPPGYTHSLQQRLYHDSFDHLYDLVVFNGGALAAKLIDLFATNLYLGGRMREEIIHRGVVHTLMLLLRRVLLRASRLGILACKEKSTTKWLWQIYSVKESPNDENQDITGNKESAPSKVPSNITKACQSLITACCGPKIQVGKRWKRPLLPVHVRRTSDLAMTAIFGMVFDLDLWGGDVIAAATIMQEFSDLYCSDGFEYTFNPPEMTEKFDSGYGRLLRGQISVQHLLDLIRMRYGNEMIIQNNGDKERREALQSLSKSLSRILYVLLKYSLFKQISLGEQDIYAIVGALSDCPLGSLGAHVVLSALIDMLVYCEILPRKGSAILYKELNGERNDVSQILETLLEGSNLYKSKSMNLEQSAKLKRVKSEIAGRLARNLLMGQFHDVVAPMLLSRTVFDGRRNLIDSDPEQNDSNDMELCRVVDTKTHYSVFQWENHWMFTLQIFVWVASVSRSEGDKVAYTAGNLLLQSAQAGSLSKCLLNIGLTDAVYLLVPILPTPSSALTPGGINGKEAHVFDSASRLRIAYKLLSGLVASLISNRIQNKNEIRDSIAEVLKRPTLLLKAAVDTLESLITVIVSMILYIQDKDVESINESRRRRHFIGSLSMEKGPVRTAVGAVPSLIMTVVLLQEPIQDFKEEYNSDRSWDFVEGSDKGSGNPRMSLEGQLNILCSCQTQVLQTTALLIAKAMVVGGGEASTVILRDVVSQLDALNSDKSDVQTTFSTVTIVERRNVLCRLMSLILMKVISRSEKKDDPWKSVELCSATARLCDLVEEKKLLQPSEHKHCDGSDKRLSLDQVRLLCALLEVMEAGRENTGWCQIIDATSSQFENQSSISDSSKKNEQSTFLKIMHSQAQFKALKYIDYDLLAKNEQIYHLINNDSHASFEIFNKIQNTSDVTNTQSFSTSKLLLPILQPALRSVLGCLGEIRSAAIVQYTSGNGGKSLLSLVLEELRSTMIAALVGLAFPHARDVCLSALSLFRKSIEHHEGNDEAFVALMYRDLFVTVVKEMLVRYESERKKREVAELFSYDTTTASIEAANSHEVERLLLGNSLVGEVNQKANNDSLQNIENSLVEGSKSTDVSDDFILFPEGGQSSGKNSTTIGWNGYKGFGVALEKCIQLSSVDEDESNAIILILTPYLDTWDEKQLIENEESELVELFDTNASISNQNSGNADLEKMGAATAADSMTSFIELASSENSRISEIQTYLLLFKRYNCLSYSESLCWKSFLEIFDKKEDGKDYFERCMADAGRDYGGRLLTVPIHPQFSRLIPKQLDHSVHQSEDESQDDDKYVSSQCISVDLDELNTLVQQGNLKILDITKKSENEIANTAVIDEDELDESDNVIVSKPPEVSAEADIIIDPNLNGNEGEELYLGFPERLHNEDNFSVSEIKINECRQKDDISLSVRSGIEQLRPENKEKSSAHNFFMSSFSNPPNSTSASLQGHLRNGMPDDSTSFGWGGLVEEYYDNCVHVKPEGNRKGTLLLTATYLIFEYDDPTGLTESEVQAIEEMKKKVIDTDAPEKDKNEYDRMIQHYIKTAAMRPKSMRWNVHELSHVYLRRYRLRDSSLEMFFLPSGGSVNGGIGLLSALSSVWLDFGSGNEGNVKRDDAASAVMRRAPSSTIKQWPEKSAHFLHEHLRNITLGWVKGRINNFDYILALNILSGRSFNDLCQYPVFPWVLSNYTSKEMPDLNDESNFRDLSKPMGALNPQRLEEFIERFHSFDDAVIPPFMYGSHYSTSAGVVLHFLVRMHPFASLHRQLQGGHFDVADRLFSSVSRTWDMCTGQSAAEVKELTPEWYCNPSFLKNANQFKLGTSQEGEILGDVILPPWADDSPEKFVEVLRCALESDICTKQLPHWIDLIFGRKQQGPAAVEANNVFFYLTYYGSCDVASIEDEDLRVATELQIAHFGQCPMQLFWRPHVPKLPKASPRRRLSLSELLELYDIQHNNTEDTTIERQLLFGSAPLEYWLHLSAPPPGPHAAIIAVRLVVPDRCLAVDAQGIFHFFRFGWRSHLDSSVAAEEEDFDSKNLFSDEGVFVAQRELPHFRSIPRLHHSVPRHFRNIKSDMENHSTVVAISKCIFNRSLLVISDGDGKGSICFQLVDPTKGVVDGQVFVPAVHSSRISALHTDPIGSAAGVGGVGGELAIVGSHDGTATVWRFISNPDCFLPLRPRLRLGGHHGSKIIAVAVSSALHICVTVSATRCCIFGLSNGIILNSISISDIKFSGPSGMNSNTSVTKSCFVDSNSVCLCTSGYITLVCETSYFSAKNTFLRNIITLELFTLEGEHMGSKALEIWRGIPHKIVPTFDGKGIMVCSTGGVSIHLISAIKPLYFVDEWRVANDDELHSGIGAYDIDFGPSLSRPVVAISGLSSGALRIHAFKGIGEWSEEINKRSTMSEAVGNVLAKPAERMKGLLGAVKGKGSKVVGLGKEIGREAVSGFLGDVFGKKVEM